MACCPERNSRIPLEFRLALGVSSTPNSFDGTAILNLCYRDPYVNEDHCGNAIAITVRDSLDAIFTPRVVASKTTPQQLFRDGSGVRLAWDVTLDVATSRLGFLPPNALRKPEVNDGSLFHLVSLFGIIAGSLQFESPAGGLAPYLFLTTSYQHPLEQWIPVEIDPNNSTLSPLTFTPEGTTAARTLQMRLVSRENYRRVLPAYVPSFYVEEIDCNIVTGLPALVPGDGGFIADPVTLDKPLPDATPSGLALGELDGILLNLANGPYTWKRFSIRTISNDRQTLSLLSQTDLSGAYLIGPAGPVGMRSAVSVNDTYLPTYKITPFAGQTAPPRGPQFPLPVAATLLGDPYDF